MTLKTVETTATEVWLHAADHGDKPVIHGAELDYDDVHDGVHYHADLIKAAEAEYDRTHAEMRWSAEKVALRASNAASEDMDPRRYGTGWAAAVAEFEANHAAWVAASDRALALRAKRDQDAAFATYEVTA